MKSDVRKKIRDTQKGKYILLTVRGRRTAFRIQDTEIQCVIRRRWLPDLRRSIYLNHFYYSVNRVRCQNLPR